ncbi:hypothetical protein DPX16_2661 [Anabarilius grahami]|uniref:Uncharacterized protein n=1 Tax=Anabarilius grahami TaxID=495550 RepID=A0A3N0Y503_ANAGA|nr:hypothetical protein DPX16_2661 [Anabarilius grahami]
MERNHVPEPAVTSVEERFVPDRGIGNAECQKDRVWRVDIVFLSVSDVEKLATVTLMEKFVPTVSGSQKLLASMDCRQLTQMHGFTDIVLKPK